ncbi:MAG TPA: DsbA family protein [Solirubrobacterales bacterium]|nr:DsbA family protein [Solirubrobacterales bacterium]
MGDLTSAPIPPAGPDDHVVGAGEGLVVYADLGCPHCAAEWPRLRERPGRLVFRHFPVAGKHPRSPALHAAAEAAGRQGRFFELVDSLYADRGKVDDPHLWKAGRAARPRPEAVRGGSPVGRDRGAGQARLRVRHPRRSSGHSSAFRCLYPSGS